MVLRGTRSEKRPWRGREEILGEAGGAMVTMVLGEVDVDVDFKFYARWW